MSTPLHVGFKYVLTEDLLTALKAKLSFLSTWSPAGVGEASLVFGGHYIEDSRIRKVSGDGSGLVSMSTSDGVAALAEVEVTDYDFRPVDYMPEGHMYAMLEEQWIDTGAPDPRPTERIYTFYGMSTLPCPYPSVDSESAEDISAMFVRELGVV